MEAVSKIRDEIPNARFGNTINSGAYPKGCFLWVKDNANKDKLYFNEHPTGSSSEDARHVCEYTVACYSSDTTYTKDPVRGIKKFHIKGITSLEDCQEECVKDPDCNFFTWISPDFWKTNRRNTCWLKAGKGIIKQECGKSCTGKISGPKICDGGCLNADGLTGYKFSHEGYWSGEYTLATQTDTASKCAAECDKDDRCIAFNYRYGDNKYCGGYHILGALRSGTNSRAYIKCFATRTTTTTTTSTSTSTSTPSTTDVQGYAMLPHRWCLPNQSMTAATLNDAAKECSDNPECHMFYGSGGVWQRFMACGKGASVYFGSMPLYQKRN